MVPTIFIGRWDDVSLQGQAIVVDELCGEDVPAGSRWCIRRPAGRACVLRPCHITHLDSRRPGSVIDWASAVRSEAQNHLLVQSDAPLCMQEEGVFVTEGGAVVADRTDVAVRLLIGSCEGLVHVQVTLARLEAWIRGRQGRARITSEPFRLAARAIAPPLDLHVPVALGSGLGGPGVLHLRELRDDGCVACTLYSMPPRSPVGPRTPIGQAVRWGDETGTHELRTEIALAEP